MKRFGLIGYPLSHSFSENYFANKFRTEGIRDCVYQNYPLENITELGRLVSETPHLEGLNVTIPYKEKVLPYLTGSNHIVQAIGACNTITIRDQKLYGFNTDVIGFEQSLMKHLASHHNKALILGEGGAAKAVAYVFEKLGIDYKYVVRKGESGERRIHFNDLTDHTLSSHTVIVNSTPIGMHPDIDKCPPIKYDILTSRHYLYDLVYNPEKTLFLQKGESRGAIIKNGYEMLLIQAEESWKIWMEDLENKQHD